eukprot:EC720248.1.p1 GENE.EC720248.1~~EC720248.1.p1  ORF type:complete len:85 (+),score=15.19 EC720248.1:45-299(+)
MAEGQSSVPKGLTHEEAWALREELFDLRVTISKESREAAKVKEEHDKSAARVKQLVVENEKLKYQVKHLIRNLEAAEARIKALS